MPLTRLYFPESLQENITLELDERNKHHIVNVLRLKPGDELHVFNGQGGEYSATLLAIGKTATININHHIAVNRESPLDLHLVQGISKGERMDYTIQKATELGVKTITPIETKRSTAKIKKERMQNRLDRWNSIIIGACEQSGRTDIPDLQQSLSFTQFIEDLSINSTSAYIFDTEGSSSYKQSLENDPNNKFIFLIGPEGGLESDEFEAAETKGFKRVRLGPRVLRTETAGPTVLAITQMIKGDLGTF